jgi:acetylserotonin N-methyltransferase
VTSPALILDLIEAFRRSKSMFVATALGIFDGARPAHPELPRLLDACVALGLLERREDQYVNTPAADEYLRSDSPRTLAGYVRYSNEILYPMWGHLEEAVRDGSNRWEQTFGFPAHELFSRFYATDAQRNQFLLGMHGFGQLSSSTIVRAFDLSRFQSFVDLGGGTGHLAQAAVDAWPQLTAAVFDLPKAVEFGRQFCDARVEFRSGDFFRDPLPPADLYAVGRILHDWDDAQCAVLLRRIADALPAGGALLIAEKLLTPESVPAHMQSLNMLICTEGRERTLAEYEALLRAAGFSGVSSTTTGQPLDALLAIK